MQNVNENSACSFPQQIIISALSLFLDICWVIESNQSWSFLRKKKKHSFFKKLSAVNGKYNHAWNDIPQWLRIYSSFSQWDITQAVQIHIYIVFFLSKNVKKQNKIKLKSFEAYLCINFRLFPASAISIHGYIPWIYSMDIFNSRASRFTYLHSCEWVVSGPSILLGQGPTSYDLLFLLF